MPIRKRGGGSDIRWCSESLGFIMNVTKYVLSRRRISVHSLFPTGLNDHLEYFFSKIGTTSLPPCFHQSVNKVKAWISADAIWIPRTRNSKNILKSWEFQQIFALNFSPEYLCVSSQRVSISQNFLGPTGPRILTLTIYILYIISKKKCKISSKMPFYIYCNLYIYTEKVL